MASVCDHVSGQPGSCRGLKAVYACPSANIQECNKTSERRSCAEGACLMRLQGHTSPYPSRRRSATRTCRTLPLHPPTHRKLCRNGMVHEPPPGHVWHGGAGDDRRSLPQADPLLPQSPSRKVCHQDRTTSMTPPARKLRHSCAAAPGHVWPGRARYTRGHSTTRMTLPAPAHLKKVCRQGWPQPGPPRSLAEC